MPSWSLLKTSSHVETQYDYLKKKTKQKKLHMNSEQQAWLVGSLMKTSTDSGIINITEQKSDQKKWVFLTRNVSVSDIKKARKQGSPWDNSVSS